MTFARFKMMLAASAVCCSVVSAEDAVVEKKVGEKTVQDLNNPKAWTPLFDGKTMKGWRNYNKKSVSPNWAVKDGEIHLVGHGGDLITEKQYGDFELKLEWKATGKLNSGIFFGAKETKAPIYNEALEMQVLMNEGWPGLDDSHIAGSMYEFYPSKREWSKPAGEWNAVVIYKKGTHVKAFFNGHQVADFKTDGAEFKALWQKSKFKDVKMFAQHEKGHIGIQDHGDSKGLVLRNLMIREL